MENFWARHSAAPAMAAQSADIHPQEEESTHRAGKPSGLRANGSNKTTT